MSRKRDRSTSAPKPAAPDGLAEFFDLLGRVEPAEGARKLQFDLARDAAVDLFNRLTQQTEKLQRRLDRSRLRRRALVTRHHELLDHLARGHVVFAAESEPSPPGQADELIATYRRLRKRTFPVLANMLHAAGGGADRVYLTLLTEEVLARGQCIIAEYLVLHSMHPRTPEQDRRFREELLAHLGGRVNRALARKTGYHLTPEVGGHLNTLLQVTIAFLWELLLSHPPMRLFFAEPGSPFDAERHERLSGHTPRHPRLVGATLFPGLLRHGPPRTLLAPVRVSTRRVTSSDPDAPDESD